MNYICLIGRLTRDVESSKAAHNDTQISRFCIACDRRFHREGEPTADFINCTSFGKTAEFISKYFKKGMRICISGRLQTGSYTNKEGKKVYTTDVIVDTAEFVESKQAASEQEQPNPAPAPEGDQGFMHIPDGIDEELPFN